MVSTADHGGAEITLCSSAGVVSAIPEGDGLKPSHHKAPAHAEGACPFAGGHAFTAPPAFAVPVATLADWPLPPAPTPVRRGMALRLRAPPPPSQAPPSVLS